jgi:MFS family permease
MKSLALSPADMGLANSCGSLAKLAANVPAATLVARVGRRPLLVGGTALEAVAMLGMGAWLTLCPDPTGDQSDPCPVPTDGVAPCALQAWLPAPLCTRWPDASRSPASAARA